MDEPIRSQVCVCTFYVVPTKKCEFILFQFFFSVITAAIPPKSNGKLQFEAA